jgi:L-threonylcarbamoyladenylate synthase
VENSKDLRQYASFFKEDSVVLFPTDTVVGLGCRFDSVEGIADIRKIKGIVGHTPLAVLISEEKQLNMLKVRRSRLSNLLISKFWPGALTLVLTAEKLYPCSGKANTIGLRMPDADFLRKIIKMVGVPLAATSANLHGQAAPAKLQDVNGAIRSLVDHVIDADLNSVGLPSTVIRIEGGALRILRNGAVTKDEIYTVVGDRFE